ncbi:MAG: M24 family metallopeptidase [Clostridium sp.]|jgi:Xaa-Pro aminopeptidase|nr:M24 family metallopeptidase [Clostridium sp.]
MTNNLYTENRKELVESIEKGEAVILFSGHAPKKTADEKYPFAPNRNFLYMTGVVEENIILYLEKTESQIKETLFIHRYDELKAKWNGETVSPEKATELSGIDEIRFMDEFENVMHQKIQSGTLHKVWLDMEKDSFTAEYCPGGRFARVLKSEYPQLNIGDIFPQIASQRVIKSPEEVAEIRRAIEITRDAIFNIWKNRRPGAYEYEMEAEFDYILKKNGVKDFAFKTICAGGKNAAVLHYVENNQMIKDGDLLLLDLGAQWNYYSADISRTFPINGKFSERQKELYQIVRLAMDRVFEAIKPGVPFKRLNEIVRETYAEELKRIGLIEDPAEVQKYYFHGVTHYLGLDTHDVGSRDQDLAPGMVLTVEPGLYIPEEGIGIRIEDDVLVTETGMENLSHDIPKDIEDIEGVLAN